MERHVGTCRLRLRVRYTHQTLLARTINESPDYHDTSSTFWLDAGPALFARYRDIQKGMIAGIGVDLATISRITQVHKRFGERFARRFLHEKEMETYKHHTCQERFLTKRFAVKEAAVKALGTGERGGVLLRDFYLQHDEMGRPLLHVSGEAKKRCDAMGINGLWVTLSDEGDTVAAFVVLEKTN